MGIISWVSKTFSRQILFFIMLIMISPGIYFSGMITIYFGWGIIAFILQWLILIIEIPLNSIIALINLIISIFTEFSLGTIDLNFDGYNTSLWDLETNFNIASTTELNELSWYSSFLSNGNINFLKMFLPFYLGWL